MCCSADKHAVARPAIGIKLVYGPNEAGSKRIEVDVTDELEKVGLFFVVTILQRSL